MAATCDELPQQLPNRRRQLVITLGAVLVLCGAWVAEGEVTQSLQNPTDGKCTEHGQTDKATGLCFDEPMEAQADCSLTCYQACQAGIGPKQWMITYCARIGWATVLLLWAGWYYATPRRPDDVLLGFGWSHYALWLPILGAVVAACGYTWFLSLNGMPVSANTAIYNTVPIAVFVLSVPLLGESVTLKKVAATLCAVCGTAIVALKSNRPPCPGDSHFSAYAWCLLSVLLYALFEVGVKKYLQHPAETFPVANSLLHLGALGAVSVVLFWPVSLVLNSLHSDSSFYEQLAWPDGKAGMLLVVNCVLDLTFNLALIVIIAVTSPLVASVASILAIPASASVDYLVKGEYYHNATAYVGISLICVGFVLIVSDESHGTPAKRETKVPLLSKVSDGVE